MSTKNDGGPAFPTGHTTRETVHIGADGMSLRDWFAGQALARLAEAVSEDITTGREKRIATSAYELADAMLAAREGK